MEWHEVYEAFAGTICAAKGSRRVLPRADGGEVPPSGQSTPVASQRFLTRSHRFSVIKHSDKVWVTFKIDGLVVQAC
jgi:hypothetical protein